MRMTHEAAAPTLFQDTYAARLAMAKPGVALAERQLAAPPGRVDPLTQVCLDGYREILRRPSKLIRPVLTLTGYELGRDLTEAAEPPAYEAVARAAGAMELIHVALLGFDDAMDNAELRRGRATVHAHMRQHLRAQGVGDAENRARSYMENTGLMALDLARDTLLNLPFPAERVCRAASIVGRGLLLTGIGQGWDILPGSHGQGLKGAIRAALGKTAYYTFALPLHVGATLAGAPPATSKDIARWALPAGLAFQWRDDRLDITGDPADTGKTPLTDLREGKKTLPILAAMERAVWPEDALLRKSLGTRSLSPGEVTRCQQIFHNTGALAMTDNMIRWVSNLANEALPPHWPEHHNQFLSDLVLTGTQRKK